MKLHIVALVGAAVGLPLDAANGDGSGEDCYPVDYTPRCAPGKLCSQVAVPGVACPWTCGAPLPDACEERCKPCREEINAFISFHGAQGSVTLGMTSIYYFS
ncbi:hypothetical protein X797_007686 [Metarhizium robertsii]|uniref:Uncharacterized protein n=1 Tax=Metarhizium robertsii TaxID=568076 RepID=A0A014NC86_9HYPO|nr:hypothetical protein X797_007686 [Metarhizium robertsii]